MTHPFSRRGRERRLAIAGDFPDTGESVTEILGRVRPADWEDRREFTGTAGMLPPGIATFTVERAERITGPFPALSPAQPEPQPPPPVLAYVPVTEPAKIGDTLRLPVTWCEGPRCIAWHHDPASAGEADSRARAIADGWAPDAFGRITCPRCQQTDPFFRVTRPLAWHHLEVARAWHENGDDLSGHAPDDDLPVKDRLAAVAEYSRRITRENPALARDLAGATRRHEQTAGGRGRHAGGVR